ncbi:MAG: DUF2794 domain-containing protein [Pseudomonadota bacterium]
MSAARATKAKVAFHRTEMRPILDVYGRMVATAEARDYAIGMYQDRAVFAIYERTAEKPTWRIEKVPALSRKQGQYVVYGSAGQVLRRGNELKAVLKVFASRRFVVVS